MATIVRELFSPHPFQQIQQKSYKVLLDLIRHHPHNGVGLRITKRPWFQAGWHDSYYDITSVKLDTKDITKAEIKGTVTEHGKQTILQPIRIPESEKSMWAVLVSQSQDRTMQQKLGIPADAPKDAFVEPLPGQKEEKKE
ncbi:hypothetical protein HK097_005436 [Rhizophlyctis rosea]|uniref:Uncharacterized protein n=1 Tax=Rhizophlyctis rosea TaxID=64517 RepID=A0AAD5X2H2_9FUNG|nr:hypothetical protein HK097_005436 [Rhizophlyctis rosea]